MPCQYLSSLVHMVADRAVILYDHLGCGQSSRNKNNAVARNQSMEPKEPTGTYLKDTVQDLAILIETILPEDSSYHLFGHSLGGIIAYQYLQLPQQPASMARRQCLSLVLASAPTNIAASHASSQALLEEIYSEMQASTSDQPNATTSSLDDAKDNNTRDNADDDDDDESGASALRRAARSEFQLRHECRSTPMPLPLQQSMEGLQRHSSQHDVASQQRQLQSYVAEPWSGDSPPPPPSLIMRGQHDFVTEDNMRRWTVLLAEDNCPSSTATLAAKSPTRAAASSQFVTLANCSHYGMAENEDLFGSVLISFLHDHDNCT
jgi:pimeloyl-ACP methyl ester carboxylesterase